jgi:nicotinamide mononucleotide adenylyltransferase
MRITVKNWRGHERKISKAEYIDEWVDYIEDLQHLMEYDEWNELVQKVKDKADRKFSELWRKELRSK